MTSAPDTRLTERQRSARRSAAGRQVWVLDDSPFEAEAARRALSEDHQVMVFSDPAVMLEAWTSRSRPDVLVLDWELPGLSGLEVCRYLRATPGGDNLAIVMLTVHRRPEDVVQALEAGANDFVTKPFQALELRARVGVHARSRERLETERDQVAVERSQWQQVAEALPQLV